MSTQNHRPGAIVHAEALEKYQSVVWPRDQSNEISSQFFMACHPDFTSPQAPQSSYDLMQHLRGSLVQLASLMPSESEAFQDQAGSVFDFVNNIVKVINREACDDPLALAALEVANAAIDFSNSYTLQNEQVRVEGGHEDLMDGVHDLVGVVQDLGSCVASNGNDGDLQECPEELRPEADACLVALARRFGIEGFAWLCSGWIASEGNSSEAKGDTNDDSGNEEDEESATE